MNRILRNYEHISEHVVGNKAELFHEMGTSFYNPKVRL